MIKTWLCTVRLRYGLSTSTTLVTRSSRGKTTLIKKTVWVGRTSTALISTQLTCQLVIIWSICQSVWALLVATVFREGKQSNLWIKMEVLIPHKISFSEESH